MRQARAVGVRQHLQHLASGAARSVHPEPLFAPQHLPQRLAGHERHHEPQQVVRLAAVEQRGDAWMMQAPGVTDLAQEAVARNCDCQLRGQHFDRDQLAALIVRAKDARRTSPPHGGDHVVAVAQRFAHAVENVAAGHGGLVPCLTMRLPREPRKVPCAGLELSWVRRSAGGVLMSVRRSLVVATLFAGSPLAAQRPAALPRPLRALDASVTAARRVRYLQPSWSFRSRYGYQNIMFLAAGQIVPAVTGQTWDDFVRRRIFTPLGMTASNTSVAQLPPGGDVATPHEHFSGKLRAIAWRNVDNVGPAGSINSNVIEMAQWVRLQLGNGVYRGQRLVSEAAVKEMRSPQTVIPLDSITERLRPSTHFQAYGLGWSLSDYRGRKLVSHNGALDGMRSIVMLVPEARVR